MALAFSRIAIYARQRVQDGSIQDILSTLKTFLSARGVNLVVEIETAKHMNANTLPTVELRELESQCDLLVVVGGDGSMLSAARVVADLNIPVVGVNRGNLGFLTDIVPDELETCLDAILNGDYQEEERFLLSATHYHNDKPVFQADAVNDVTLAHSDIAHMIEFEISIDDKLVLTQRADGVIVATPTGSTAYSLSGGGPILHPKLDAVTIVPVCPHTLSSRPIVIDAEREIKITISESNATKPCLTCDGHEQQHTQAGDYILISKKQNKLRLIHPLDYNYYETLRSKLGWQAKHGA